MSKVFFSVGVSLEGYIAGTNDKPSNPLGDGGMNIHAWIYKQQIFREVHNFGEGGETGSDNDLLIETTNRIGACIMGKKMFENGEPNWPENAPFHCPVFVLTKEKRDPWERKGGTTFYFVNDGLESAYRQAKEAAGNKDIRLAGGANIIQQYLNAGLVDDFTIHQAPVFLGGGTPLFHNIDASKNVVELVESIQSDSVLHLKYIIKK